MSRYTLEITEPDGSTRLLEATEEQEAIIDYALAAFSGGEIKLLRLLINALAGAAKTSTLRFLCKYLPAMNILSLAFNKRIADEMTKVLPPHVKASTVNSIGHRTWASAIGRRLIVDTKKNYNIIKTLVDELPRSERSEGYEIFGDLTKTLARAKLSGYVPVGTPAGRSLLSPADFFGSLEEEPDEWFMGLLNKALAKSIQLSFGGLIDYDDQIYMPTLFGGSFPIFDLVMGDEVQDFSPLNHAMLECLVRANTHLIGVGDPWQSIYAFRGADTKSMSFLRKRFDMHEMNLSVSFRVPRAGVLNVHKRVPHMKWAPWAIEGTVKTLTEWNADTIPDGSAILCRNNAPLMTMALALLRAKRGVHLVGTDLGPQLVKALKRLGHPNMTQEQVLHAIDQWEADKLKKTRDSGATSDKADCLRVFAGFGPTLGAAIAFVEHIFQQKGPIQLLSGHKAKGLEWHTVFHLDPHRIPSPWAKEGEALEQELNVQYVIETRFKDTFYYVRMEDFTDVL